MGSSPIGRATDFNGLVAFSRIVSNTWPINARRHMAKRPTPTQPQAPRLSPTEMRAAIARFKRRLAELADFDPNTVQDRSDPKVRKLEVAIDEALSEAFGHRTPEYSRYSAATNLDTAIIIMGRRAPPNEIVEGLIRGKERAVALLESAIQFFEEKLADLGNTAAPLGEAGTRGATLQTDAPSRDIFIVHGRDELAKQEVARLIEHAGLHPPRPQRAINYEPPQAHRCLRCTTGKLPRPHSRAPL